MEFGTKNYPFKTFRAVSSEILNHLSSSNSSIVINLKEGTKVYIEDDTTYFIEFKNISIKSYSENDSDGYGRAQIIPSAIQQHSLSGHSLFNILNHANLSINEVIVNKATDTSLFAKLTQTEVTFKIFRTEFSLLNVNVYREVVDYNTDKIVLFPIDLQNRSFTLSNIDFNVSGSIMCTIDPMNFHLENVHSDTYSLVNGFASIQI